MEKTSPCIVGQHFKQFYCRQLKKWTTEWNVSHSVINVNKMCFTRYVNWAIISHWIKKVIFRWLYFPQVLQKQTLGEVENWIFIWWQVVSGIFVPKIIKILIGFQVTVKIVGDVFLIHSVQIGNWQDRTFDIFITFLTFATFACRYDWMLGTDLLSVMNECAVLQPVVRLCFFVHKIHNLFCMWLLCDCIIK